MSEGDYEYECMRCDLLGLPRPEKETRPRPVQDSADEDLDVDADLQPDTEVDQDIELKEEHLKNASGGLDELNNILSITQKKLNKFKVVCGSFTNLLRLKVGGRKGDDTNSECSSRGSIGSDTEGQRDGDSNSDVARPHQPLDQSGQGDQSGHTDSRVDKLDSLLMKAERAHISMTSQNKQMKEFLK